MEDAFQEIEDAKKCFVAKEYKHSEWHNVNFILIPITRFSFNEEDIEEFNKIYTFVLNLPKLGEITRTKSGGISVSRKASMRKYVNVYDLRQTTTLIELTLGLGCVGWFRFQIGYAKENKPKNKMCGRKAFIKFKDICKKHNINLEDFAITKEEGLKEKESMEKPMIKMSNNIYHDRIFENAHHLDLNSSYMSGIMKYFPELTEPIREVYSKKAKYKEINKNKAQIYKDILNMTYGFMQSSLCDYKYAHISKKALEYNNNMIRQLAKELVESGRRVIAYNTDGIWYEGDIFHNKDEGNDLLQWKNDHINCTIRFKSAGCYEFIEDNKYYPVVRGTLSYERIVPREKWEFGDIYKGHILQYKFEKGVGIVLV